MAWALGPSPRRIGPVRHRCGRSDWCRTRRMIIITGSAQVRSDELGEAVRLSLEHVNRSRLEPGCLLHSVHHDVEDANRLVFVEHWADADAVRAHFAVPASRAFSKALAALCEASSIELYDATEVRL